MSLSSGRVQILWGSSTCRDTGRNATIQTCSIVSNALQKLNLFSQNLHLSHRSVRFAQESARFSGQDQVTGVPRSRWVGFWLKIPPGPWWAHEDPWVFTCFTGVEIISNHLNSRRTSTACYICSSVSHQKRLLFKGAALQFQDVKLIAINRY